MARPIPRVPSFSGRPGFPNGLQVVLVERDVAARASAQRQLHMLAYEVSAFETCGAAAATFAAGAAPDIMLVEAKLLAEDNEQGRHLIDASSSLPFVLMSDKEASISDVWRGIELGAADVLEKPLSLLKLRNIWQHVVRKMMDNGGAAREGVELLSLDTGPKGLSSSPSSPRTSLPMAGQSTPENAEKSGKHFDEASFSGTGEARKDSSTALEAVEPTSTLATADSPALRAAAKLTGPVLPKAGASPPLKKGRKGGEPGKALASVANRPPLAIRPPPWVPGPGQGMLPPSQTWIPHQMSSISQLSTESGGLDLTQLDECLLDDVLLPEEGAFLEALDSPSCDSSPDLAMGLSFFDLDDIADAPKVPPIGLALKKSESLLDLINSHLKGCSARALAA